MTPTSPFRLADLPAPPRGMTGWPWDVEAPSLPEELREDLPSVTVVTPSFNQSAFVEATLRSVLLQGYPHLEYIVVDGGSSDGTREVIERYAPYLASCSSQRDSGPAEAINRGFARARGDVIAWLNSDDRYFPGTLHAVARAVRDHPEAVAWIGGCRSVRPDGTELYVNVPHGLRLPELADWLGDGWFAQPASFYRRTAAERAGRIDESLQSSFDVDFFLRLIREGPFVGTADLWAEETVHPAARTSAAPGRAFAELRLVQIRHGFEAIALRRLTLELGELFWWRRMTLRDLLRKGFSTRVLGKPWHFDDPSRR